MDEIIKNKIKESLKIAIRNFFKNKEVKTSNILDYLFPKERRIRSLIGGLETSIGTVWETIAKTLADVNGFEIITEKILMPEPFPDKLRRELDHLINEREHKFISTDDCIKRLRDIALISRTNNNSINFVKPPAGHGVDIYLKKGDVEYIFDLKSPQSNTGDFKRFNKQLLEWYAYKFAKDPQLNLEARIAFTFNPFKRDWYEEQKSKISTYLDISKDIYVENEFWDFCSGEDHTWEKIQQLFIELGQENFSKEFHDIFYSN
jgi:hypothetical protein